MKKHKNFPLAIIAIIIAAFIFGCIIDTTTEIFGINIFNIVDVIGRLFINALTLIVVPLICSSIINGISKIKGDISFGKIGKNILLTFISTNFLAILMAFVIVMILNQPITSSISSFLSSPGNMITSYDITITPTTHNFADTILQIIPSNIVAAFSQGQMLGLIFFSLIFGYVITKLPSKKSFYLTELFSSIFLAMIEITHIVMKFIPLGIFCLISKHIAQVGIETLRPLLIFVAAVIISLLSFALIILPIISKIFKIQFIKFIKAITPALIAAFSTSSTSATLPISLDCVEKNVGISNRIASIILPLGGALNMAGSALYTYITAYFILHLNGIDITVSSQIMLILLSLITTMGVAGIPSAAFVSIIIILKTFGVSIEWIGIFLAIDRIIDMFRTVINVLTINISATIIAKTQGEKIF
jgi:proton glutamate symport protein